MMEEKSQPLPLGWAAIQLGEVCRIRNGYAFKSKDFQENGVPLVRQSNLTGKDVNLDGCVFLPESYLAEYSNHHIRRGGHYPWHVRIYRGAIDI